MQVAHVTVVWLTEDHALDFRRFGCVSLLVELTRGTERGFKVGVELSVEEVGAVEYCISSRTPFSQFALVGGCVKQGLSTKGSAYTFSEFN